MIKKLLPIACIAAVLGGCSTTSPTRMSTEMFNTDGDSLGTITMSEQPEGVKFVVMLEGLPAGEYGLHVHEKPLCEAPDFKTAGEHYNPDKKDHGLLNPKGAHLGDLQNLVADDKGMIQAEIFGPKMTLKKGSKNTLLFKGGTSLIINEKKDDGMTQPAGNSGPRIACGVITEKEAQRQDKREVEMKKE
ncbi:superoxide dismutase family protein [Metabacillus sp. RGM 3146]|uniref:superoxide dismutase family protein n=1 Tax=Metabacillus sp. RGM 3146 TaxID=3401092 RepID=UPI003B9DB83F